MKNNSKKFYAPWCSHCQAMAETWKQLGMELKGRVDIRIGSVDCTIVPEVCKNQGVNGYPTLILFKNGAKYKDYQNSRSLADFLSFIQNNLGHDDL